MGGLLAFRVGNFDNTAEREQFRFLCEQLKAHYEDSNEFCVFAGNYNIGCELDALFIKKDAIIAIEFKNYGGKVIANENGEWTCDGKVIKGGSRKTVLQQARVNHSILKKELKVLGVKPQNIKDVPTLVIFNQPVEITNNLSATNKSWLHITDNEHFIEKLDDITCPHTDLDPLGIVNLAELLNLNSFFLTEFSNAVYDKPEQPTEHLELFEDIKKYEAKNVPAYAEPNPDEQNIKKSEDNLAIEKNVDDKGIYIQEIDSEMLNYKKYFEDILNNVLDNVQYQFTICRTKDIFSKSEYNLPFEPSKEFTLYVHANNIILGKKRLENFLRHEIYVINENELCWEEGEDMENINPIKKNDKEEQQATNRNTSVQNSSSHVKKIKALIYNLTPNKKNLRLD